MADIHLKFEGIDGESKAIGYEKQIDCDSWHWSAFMPTSGNVSTGSSAGTAQIGDISISKPMDAASPNFWQYLCQCMVVGEATLTCTRGGGEKIVWLEIIMTNVSIVKISAGSQEGSLGQETLELKFESFEMNQFTQESDGTQGTGITASYDIRVQR